MAGHAPPGIPVIDQNIGVSNLVSNLSKRFGSGIARNQVKLAYHAFAALLSNRNLQRRGIGGAAGRQYDEESLLCELLGDGAPNSPAYAYRQVAIVNLLAVRQ